MSKDLVIVESPAKARTISRILGNKYTVLASMGHVRDLPARRGLGIKIDQGFEPQYEVIPGRKRQVVAELRKAIADADIVYLATDPDREGEAIAWHLHELLKKARKKVEFQRVTFHEITRHAVMHAFSEPGEIDVKLVDAQQARRVLDRLVGFEVSPILWRNFNEDARSAGRVQSVALRLICEREAAIVSFEPVEYWNLHGEFSTPCGEKFPARLARLDGEKVEIGNGDLAKEVVDFANAAAFEVTKVDKAKRKKRPSPPFITSTLQQAASANLRMSANQTMRIAQELYEGVDTENGPVGLITYMRTDSVNVSKDASDSARAYIHAEFGLEYLPEKAPVYKSRSGAQEAHEAIRPTDLTMDPKTVAAFMTPRQVKLYQLIWNRFLASQMADAQYELYTIELGHKPLDSDPHTLLFRASHSTLLFPGYRKIYDLSDTEENGDDDSNNNLPEMKPEIPCGLQTLEADQKFTEPPPRFSEATLVRELENNGIGRPSTYAAIVNTIQTRKYVERKERKLAPTELGNKVNHFLVDRLNKLFAVDFTAQMEAKLDEIEQGNLAWRDMVGNFYTDFSAWLDKAQAVPELPEMRTFFAVFPAGIDWDPPVQRGRGRTYNDAEFYDSLQERLGQDKRLSVRQWNALLNLAVRYEKHLPTLDTVATDVGVMPKIQELRDRRNAQKEAVDEGETKIMVAALVHVTKWEPPTKRGRQTYDDKELCESLAAQFESGKGLTVRQQETMRKRVEKYFDQIPNYDEIAPSLSLPTLAELQKRVDDTRGIVDLARDITNFAPPAKGRRKFNEEEFVTSLIQQFDEKAFLTERQLSNLRRVVVQHSNEIADFAARSKGLELEEPQKISDVDCPQCDDGKMAERRSRGRVFFGCNKYPKCKYTNRNLEDVPARGAATADAE
jgi:DNA topoisomerase I